MTLRMIFTQYEVAYWEATDPAVRAVIWIRMLILLMVSFTLIMNQYICWAIA